ncbi:MAG: hypothetical protein QG564_1337 [Campylobacterota bacterium]|nr:hypothetical protein [Campylobacterota bacterium]
MTKLFSSAVSLFLIVALLFLSIPRALKPRTLGNDERENIANAIIIPITRVLLVLIVSFVLIGAVFII